MATKFYFNNRQITLPGAYSTIVSGETNPPRSLDYGKVLIIDTGVFGAGFGGGSGIKGELAEDQDAIYTFKSIDSFRSYQKGGMWWRLVEPLFAPDPANSGAVGISELQFVRAASTTAATITFEIETGDKFVIKPKDEGVWANGVVDADGKLQTGYGFLIDAGILDPDKWVFKLYRGTFTGTYTDGHPYGDELEVQTRPLLLCQSPEIDNLQELIDWATNDTTFGTYFELDASSTAAGGGEIVPGDVTALTGYTLATGGTESYTPALVDDVLKQIVDLDYNIVITDQFGASANGTINEKVIRHINNDATWPHFMYIGGYEDEANWNNSIALARGFNSERIVLVHGDVGKNTDFAGPGYRWWGVMYNLAAVAGRVSGKPPYIPVTNKTLGFDRVKHVLSKEQQEEALENGVLVTKWNAGLTKFVVLQGINTLQDNAALFNSNGQSFSIQFMRIVHQINKELVVNAEIDLLGTENGTNVNTLSKGIVENWTVGYLKSITATDDADNLILGFENVVAERREDSWFVKYSIRVNNEITKIFFTGFLIR